MLGTLAVELQAGELLAPTDAVLGQHALDSQFHGELGTLRHERAVLDVLQVADPAGVMIVVLVVELLAVRTALSTFTMMTKSPQVNVRGEVNLVLAAQQLGVVTAVRPKGLPAASRTYQFLWTVSFLAIVVMFVPPFRKPPWFSP